METDTGQMLNALWRMSVQRVKTPKFIRMLNQKNPTFSQMQGFKLLLI
jgi:heme-degrading monooxygenase HmoA